jgi:hypothetical protein
MNKSACRHGGPGGWVSHRLRQPGRGKRSEWGFCRWRSFSEGEPSWLTGNHAMICRVSMTN